IACTHGRREFVSGLEHRPALFRWAVLRSAGGLVVHCNAGEDSEEYLNWCPCGLHRMSIARREGAIQCLKAATHRLWCRFGYVGCSEMERTRARRTGIPKPPWTK